MKFSERMQMYSDAMSPAPDRYERRMKYLALYFLETHMEYLVTGEAYKWDYDTINPDEFCGKSVFLPEHGVRFFFLKDGKVCVENDEGQ